MTNYVSFREEDHSYRSRSGKPYKSVTQIISLFKQDFDGEYWSLYKAIEEHLTSRGQKGLWWNFRTTCSNKVPKEAPALLEGLKANLGMFLKPVLELQVEIKERWKEKSDQSCIRGTAYHLKREHQAYELGYQDIPGTNIVGEVQNHYTLDLAELPDGFYPELLVYNHEYEVAGQIDRVFISTEPISLSQITVENLTKVKWVEGIPYLRYIDLDDWKSNSKIKTENKYQRMKAPLAHLEDCSYSHYSLQLNIYSYLLENFGFISRSLRFTWVHEKLDMFGEIELDQNGEVIWEETPYPIAYMKTEVEAMLTHYQQTKNQPTLEEVALL